MFIQVTLKLVEFGEHSELLWKDQEAEAVEVEKEKKAIKGRELIKQTGR